MRVHELDEAYGASKDQVKRALELADLSTHHLSRLDESELKSFESALDSVIDEDVEDIEGMLEDFDSALKGEPSPLVSDEVVESAVAYYEGEIDEPLPEFDNAVGEEELEEIRGDGPFILSSEDDGAFELMPQDHVFPCCDDRGGFTENCLLSPDLAEKVAPLLGSHRINSYLLNLDRGEFTFVVWETARKHRVLI